MTKAVNFTIQKPVHVFFFSFLCFYIMKILCLEYSVTFFDTIGYDYQKNNDLRWYHCGVPLWYQHHTLVEPWIQRSKRIVAKSKMSNSPSIKFPVPEKTKHTEAPIHYRFLRQNTKHLEFENLDKKIESLF